MVGRLWKPGHRIERRLLHVAGERHRIAGLHSGHGSQDAIPVRYPVDYDGQAQPEADVTTRGVVTEDGRTLFLDVYPAIATTP